MGRTDCSSLGGKQLFNCRKRRAGIVVVAAAWAGLICLSWLAYQPPAPRDADIPGDEFSAQRARTILRDLVGDRIPHPSGSPQNGVVRDRILKYLREFGYEPQIQSSTANVAGKTIPLHNIAVRRAGSEPGRAVMLVGHYDSVPAGPGASDDGAAVAAILEIARMLRDQPPSRHDVILLFTDGEELGMYGAQAFVRDHPWAKDVIAAINLEARGTSGPSLMFETGADNAWIVELFAQCVTRPATSSLYYEVYRTLPNDTDFSVFKGHGIEGCNFAFIRNVRNYHTSNDDFAHADPASLQHHGDNAWQMLGALANCDFEQRPRGRAIYTDIMGRWVLWWLAWFNPLLAIAALGITALAAKVTRVRGLRPTMHWQSFFAFPVALVAALLSGEACDLVFRFFGLAGKRWSNYPLPIIAIYMSVAAAAVIIVLRSKRFGTDHTWNAWLSTWLWWNAIGLLTALLLPGGSYLFILPGLAVAIGGLFAAQTPTYLTHWGLLETSCLGAIAAGVLWWPVSMLLYDGLGFSVGIVYSVCAAVLMLTVAPFVNSAPE